MDDETLAPFVDALASALIIMVLVAIFFLLQTATSLESAAKVMSISEKPVEEDRPLFNPVIFRKPMSVDLANNHIVYLVNFELNEQQLEEVRNDMLQGQTINISFYSNDKEMKTTANLIRFLMKLNLPKDVSIQTSIQTSDSSLSQVKWEVK
jgi:hypothetical protein